MPPRDRNNSRQPGVSTPHPKKGQNEVAPSGGPNKRSRESASSRRAEPTPTPASNKKAEVDRTSFPLPVTEERGPKKNVDGFVGGFNKEGLAMASSLNSRHALGNFAEDEFRDNKTLYVKYPSYSVTENSGATADAGPGEGVILVGPRNQTLREWLQNEKREGLKWSDEQKDNTERFIRLACRLDYCVNATESEKDKLFNGVVGCTEGVWRYYYAMSSPDQPSEQQDQT